MSLIMVVDDDDDIRHAVGEIARREGHESLGATNGREALELLRASSAKPDLILLDLVMPECTGWDLLIALEQDPQFASVPIALMSSHPSVRRAFEQARKSPERARLLLPKPLNVLRLLALLDDV
jgi:CheY-like chemotaxis protein